MHSFTYKSLRCKSAIELNSSIELSLSWIIAWIISDKTLVPDFQPWDLLPVDKRNYYRYQGSLTTPTCSEVVVWTLFEERNTISQNQVALVSQKYTYAAADS